MLYRYILAGLCVLASSFVFSQDNAAIRKGDACMKKGEYDRAAEFYLEGATGNSKITGNHKLAAALIALDDYQNAERIDSLLVSLQPDSSIDRFNYAQVLRRNGKYEDAGRSYSAYFKAHPNDPLAADFSDFENKALHLLAVNNNYKLTDLPENTSGSEVGPTFCFYSLCYSSNHLSGQKKQTYDLYLTQGGNPSNPAAPEKLKGDVNGELDEGPATFSSNGKEMIFTRSNYGHKGADGVMRQGLYHADYDTAGKKWVNITALNFIDYNYNFMQPSLSRDGSTLYFASDIKGGLGETDIYVCHKNGNTWSTPVNLGSGINTTGKEQTPFISDDGTLYFASDSRMGLGGLDIYAATQVNGVWGNATNLGAPLNSSYDDFGYIHDATGKSGYIVSNRPGGKGGNDIYQFISLK